MRTISVFLGSWILLTNLCASPTPRKKLIEYGWDVPYPDFVRAHIREMERRPFDGLIFRLKEFNHAFDIRRWDEKDLQPQFEDLANIKWGKFTDNFLCLYSANHWGMDWFNDEHWKNIISNLHLLGKAVKAGHCVGICFDPEPYGPNPWEYPGMYKGKTFAEVSAQVRKRGAEFIKALQEEVPNLRLLTFFHFSLFAPLLGEKDPFKREEQLASNPWALLPAFLNGILDGMGPGVRFIDGNELAYYYTSRAEFANAYNTIRGRVLPLVAPNNRKKYRNQVQVGMAIYIDHLVALREPEGGYLSYYLTPEERLKWLEHNTYYALKTAEEYVWCYSERMSWWENKVPLGVEEAIRSAVEKVRKGKPLGFEIEGIIEKGKERQREKISSQLIKRSARIPYLPPGEEPPRIDGELDEAVWQNIPPLEDFLPNAGSGRRDVSAKTRTWVIYDDEALYIAFLCEEPNLGEVKVVGEKRDDPIWQGDVVEVFLSSGEKPTPYYHFIVNPKNLQWDGIWREKGDDSTWNGNWRSAVGMGENEWRVEIAIPWREIGGKPNPGGKRRANLCRQRQAGGYELSSWSSVVEGFLEPENFGTWEF